jgi:hypothetical protein
MRPLLPVLGLLVFARLTAAPLPPAAQIVTEAEIREAAADVPVAKIEFTVPEREEEAEEALSQRFFNQPEEHRYSGLTNADWQAKWQLFSDALVAKAERQGFDSKSLEACMRALNRGRNLQTALWPIKEQSPLWADKKTSKAEIDSFEKKAEEEYQLALKERERNPEPFYNDSLAIVPVAAYLGRYSKGDCWIIVCKWEYFSKDEPMPLGHIKIWALDTRTASVVSYVTCD